MEFYESIEQADKDIKYLKEEVIPMLKSNKAYSITECKELIVLFYNVGAQVQMFGAVASNLSSDLRRTVLAKKYKQQLEEIVLEVNTILEIKSELE